MVVIGAIWTALNLLPGDLLGSGGDQTPPAVAVATTATPPAATASVDGGEVMAPDVSGEPASTAAPASGDAATPATPPSPTPASSLPPPVSEETTPLPTPVGDLEGFWTAAEDAFAVQDWQAALDSYTLVRRIDPEYERDLLVARLFDSRLGLAAEHLTANRLADAARELDLALALRPDDEAVVRIDRALEALIAADAVNEPPVRQSLWGTLVNYAGQLAADERFCGAAAQLIAATAILPDDALDSPLAQYQAECDRLRALAQIEQALGTESGKILYSTQEGSRYNIYAAAAQIDADSTLLIADGAQVGAPMRGSLLAFHGALPAEPGISLFDSVTATDPTDRLRRVTEAPEDARDAPPSWSPDGSMLVYSSTRSGVGRSRVYVHTLSSGAEVDLGLGKDPTWEPGGTRIIYNGFDERGENPGLYLMDMDGDNRLRLTDNGNDVRPVWSPDGNNVVFMSTRDGDMDVYRLSLRDGALVQLTNEPSQDGLPVVSLDSKLVLFASDRGGVWRLYVTSIDGGPTVQLLEINGVMVNWLEHSIQWTR
jgi:hypothetical protein